MLSESAKDEGLVFEINPLEQQQPLTQRLLRKQFPSSCLMSALPAEIWTQIFDLAADEDLLFQPGIPTSLAESAWVQDYWKSQIKDESTSKWSLRAPEQAMDILQRRSYGTKKVRVTVQTWEMLLVNFSFYCN